jgi:hypothetical protein
MHKSANPNSEAHMSKIENYEAARAERTKKSMEFVAALDLLLSAVESDEEYNTLRQLVHRSGAGWVCATNWCRGINNHVDGRCCGCDKLRPRNRETPVPESTIGMSIAYGRRIRREAEARQNVSEVVDSAVAGV